MSEPPLIALTLGDPAGIGPEIALAALQERRLSPAARLLVLGPERLRPPGVPAARLAAGALEPLPRVGAPTWFPTGSGEPVVPGRVQAAGGREALAALRAGHELALSGAVQALVTGPVSKAALHLAGEEVEGQSELLGRWCGVERFQMLAVAGDLRVLLLSRHMPLRAALELVTRARTLDHLHLLDAALRELGIERPRLALAGLNPHAGEGGLLGEEEGRELEPAAADARAAGLDVTGPLSPDSVFAQAAAGRFDGVLALYHDQAFIPIKLLGRERGLTVLAGLPYLRVSPAHGTAFDLVGTGRASPENLIQALLQAAAWARTRSRPPRDGTPSTGC